MNARIRRLAIGATLSVAAACGREQAESAMTSFDHAVAAANAIQAMPERTDSILAAHGLTRAGFDALMYEIAADSSKARAYTQAIR